MNKKLTSLWLAGGMLLGLAGCGAKPAAEAPAQTPAEATTQTEAAKATVTYVDDVGRSVEVPEKIETLVPTGTLGQIVLYAIAPEKFVGLSNKWGDSARGIIDEKSMNLPYFGQIFGSDAGVGVEELAAANPQILLDIGEAKKTMTEELDTLQAQTNIPAVFVSATLKTMPETYRKLGKLLSKEQEGEALATYCEQTYQRTEQIMQQVGDKRVRALYITGEKGTNVIAKASYHAELIDMLTDNLAVVDNPSSKGTGNEVNMEQISLWNPDFIIFAPDCDVESIVNDAAWANISAIASQRYIKVPNVPHNWMGSPPSVQRYLGMLWLPSVLYPESCDYDVKDEVKKFYQLFYHADLTDEQYATITEGAFLK